MPSSIAPQGVLDDTVAGALREKYSEKMSRMGRGDPASFDELFSYACPKFVTPHAPSADSGATGQEAYRCAAARSAVKALRPLSCLESPRLQALLRAALSRLFAATVLIDLAYRRC